MNNKNNGFFIFICMFFAVTNIFAAKMQGAQSVLENTKPIKIGILRPHPKNTTVTEKFIINATLLAIEEINKQGGVLKRKIEPVIINCPSDQKIIIEEVEQKIDEKKVSVIFCCGNSFISETVSPICEKYDIPMFFPCKSGKFKKFPNVIYTGTMPNQQISPAIKWSSDNFGKKYFLVGSDTNFSKVYNSIIKENINVSGGKIIGEICIPEDSGDFDEAMRKIIEVKPDVILNTISGESNVYFFINLWVKKIKSDKVPVISFDISENDFKNMSPNEAAGNYIIKSYFQNIDSKENNKFFSELKEKCGEIQIIDDSVEAGYFGVYLWKQAVEDAETDNAKDFMRFMTAQNFNAPEGMVCVSIGNQYTWKTIKIGKIGKNKQFEIVWCSDAPVNPEPGLLLVEKPKSGSKNTLEELHKNREKNAMR
ncbi:MAG: transporter substrate-binding protein [bacterium]|nr:transporter substrate-binding protein [bacterium]